MTIRKGEDWGRVVPRPEGLHSVGTDHDLGNALSDDIGRAVLVTGGDLARTLGSSRGADRSTLNQLPIDLLRVTTDGGLALTAVAHVVARLPRRAGSWFRGEVLFVMNAQFHGAWNVIPRGHPNDGRADVLRIDPGLAFRQRFEAARRARSGGHLPHPGVKVRRVESAEFTFPRPMVIVVDSVAAGTSGSLRVDVDPDAAVVYA
jgi:hypothetical protein